MGRFGIFICAIFVGLGSSFSGPALALASNGKVDAVLFKELFLESMEPLPSESEHGFPIYLPGEDLTSPPKGKTAEEMLKDISTRYASSNPSKVYREGIDKPRVAKTKPEIENLLRKHPITIVVISGYFNELFQPAMFPEVFQRTHSSFAREWRRIAADHFDSPDLQDHVFSMEKLQNVPESLPSLFQLASIDDGKGRPLIRAILLNTPKLSLETMGNPRATAQTYSRRLKKLFKLIGTPENLVLVGFSRGATVALEMLSEGKRERENYLSNVRGMISLVGVTFGSEAADELRQPGTRGYQQLNLLRELRYRLKAPKDVESISRWWQIVKENTIAWKDYVVGMAKVGPDTNLLVTLLLLRAHEGVDAQNNFDLAKGLAAEFGISSRFVTEYSDNIRRFQLFIDSGLEGLDHLSTDYRLKWWREHEIPTKGIRYYALPAVMTDPADNIRLASNRVTYDTSRLDHKFMLANYRNYRKGSGFALNDGQVAAHKVAFWPELIEKLNSRQERPQTTLLGFAGTHHWGSGMSEVFKMKPPRSFDPYPRLALFTAFAAAVSYDLENGGIR